MEESNFNMFDPKTLQIPCSDSNLPPHIFSLRTREYDYRLIDRQDCTELFSNINIYFDGEYYVADLPPGFKLYAGTLAQDHMLMYTYASIKMISQYQPMRLLLKPEDFQSSGPSWFGGRKIATYYAKDKRCSECIYAFKTTRKTTMLVLPNIYNLVKLAINTIKRNGEFRNYYYAFTGLEKFVNVVLSSYNDSKDESLSKDTKWLEQDNLEWLTPSYISKLNYNKELITRRSEGSADYLMSIEIKKMYANVYNGYISPFINNGGIRFHEEVMMSNPNQDLMRDFSDPIDIYNEKILQGPVLKSFIAEMDIKVSNDNTQWDYTVWSLLYAEKLLERYGLSRYLNITSDDRRYISFITLVLRHPHSPIIEDLARELKVTLDPIRWNILDMVSKRYHEFEEIVREVSINPTDYVIDKRPFMYRGFKIDRPHCNDYKRNYRDYCLSELDRNLNIQATEKLSDMFKRYHSGLTSLEFSTLLVVSIAHVLGLIPYGTGRITVYSGPHNLYKINAKSQYFPILNRYRTAYGTPQRATIMRKFGVNLGELAIQNKLSELPKD